jgi:hypothetical protein
MLEEAEKTFPESGHLSTVDVFAAMDSTAMEGNSSPPPGVQTMAVKLKARHTLRISAIPVR